MYLSCYSSNDNPLALASIYDFCLNHLLLKWLPNGDFLSSSFHLCLLVGNSFPLFSIYVCIDVYTYLLMYVPIYIPSGFMDVYFYPPKSGSECFIVAGPDDF